jgi:hypothetical protein
MWLMDAAGVRVIDYVRPAECGVNEGSIARNLARMNRIGCSTVLFRRTDLEATGGFPTVPCLQGNGEDWALWLRVACRARVAYVPEALVGYRRHGRNVDAPLSATTYSHMIAGVLREARGASWQAVWRGAEEWFYDRLDSCDGVRRTRTRLWLQGLRTLGPRFAIHGWRRLKGRCVPAVQLDHA